MGMSSKPEHHAILEIRISAPTDDEFESSTSGLFTTIETAVLDSFRRLNNVRIGDVTEEIRRVYPHTIYATVSLRDEDDGTQAGQGISIWRSSISVHVFLCAEDELKALHMNEDEEKELESGQVRDEKAEALCDIADIFELPSVKFETVWEHLHFEAGVKRLVMGYARTACMLSERNVENEIVGWNGVLLFHGPAGTGKTSLCRGLAQKVAIRMNARRAVLAEVRVEKVMSKFFTESSKRVRSLFERIKELARGREFVFVVLDEVESIGLSRKGRVDGIEPSDGIRVVNSLLGGIDSLKEFRNCVVLCTSNLVDGIDEALMDRTDVSLYVGEPCKEARARILREILEELAVKGVVRKDNTERRLDDVACACEGLSGRKLKKLPVIAIVCGDWGGADGLPVDEARLIEAMVKVATMMKQGAGGGNILKMTGWCG